MTSQPLHRFQEAPHADHLVEVHDTGIEWKRGVGAVTVSCLHACSHSGGWPGYRCRNRGARGPRSANLGIVVIDNNAPTPVPTALPATGTTSTNLWLGLGMVVLGAILAAGGRRTRSPRTA